MKYWLHPEAENDLRDAARFYRDHADVTLSRAFLSEFKKAVNLLLRHPRIGSLLRKGRRRLVLPRFPYSVIYTISADEIRVLAVAHHSRKPGYWRDRT